MKKLLAALLKAGLPRWLVTAIGIAFLLVLLRAAGIDVGRYADQTVTWLLTEIPLAKALIVGGLIGIVFGSVVSYLAIRLSWLMGYPYTRETKLMILMVALPIVFAMSTGFYILNRLTLQANN